jgi:hypothetical protein
MDEVRRVRNRMSKRLLDAERRDGGSVAELRRMGREAAAWMSSQSGSKTPAAARRRRKAQ